MFTHLRSLLAAGLLMALLSAPAMAQGTARIPLDWEPAPDSPSWPVKVCICGCEKIVGLIGGTEIRERKLSLGATARSATQPSGTTNVNAPPARRTGPFRTSVVLPRVR